MRSNTEMVNLMYNKIQHVYKYSPNIGNNVKQIEIDEQYSSIPPDRNQLQLQNVPLKFGSPAHRCVPEEDMIYSCKKAMENF